MPSRLTLSVAAVITSQCAHIWANGARRDGLLEALVYQLSWSVIVIANGFSTGLVTVKRGLNGNCPTSINEVWQMSSYFQFGSASTCSAARERWLALKNNQHTGENTVKPYKLNQHFPKAKSTIETSDVLHISKILPDAESDRNMRSYLGTKTECIKVTQCLKSFLGSYTAVPWINLALRNKATQLKYLFLSN